jgi:UDP-3-O-[3-hydroxymyristoyl] glucosamine N-acyltransferase
LIIHHVPDEDIVAGVPAKSIKYKVTSDKLFLMAGQKQQFSDVNTSKKEKDDRRQEG